jgi:hypothetical protein
MEMATMSNPSVPWDELLGELGTTQREIRETNPQLFAELRSSRAKVMKQMKQAGAKISVRGTQYKLYQEKGYPAFKIGRKFVPVMEGISRLAEAAESVKGNKRLYGRISDKFGLAFRLAQAYKPQEAFPTGASSAPPDLARFQRAGAVKRLGRLAKRVNIDHSSNSQVFDNLQKSSHKQLKRALTVYKAAKKLFPDDPDIHLVLERIRVIMKRAPKNRSKVKKIKI